LIAISAEATTTTTAFIAAAVIGSLSVFPLLVPAIRQRRRLVEPPEAPQS
jgi:hypothetical protein